MEHLDKVLDDYFQCWNEAFLSKNGDKLRNYMSKSFVGYWANSNLELPDQYDNTYDIEAVLKQYDNAEKSFEPVSISMRKDGEEFVVIGTETAVIDGKAYPAKCMFVWRREENEWKLLREYIELEK
ncbi:nuclear transport factor 2 family protein [Cytobacillus dafuensis]|uniref:Nuclear transport factor 2 family protein n=1 Tax=Cytobacillus dafuensis TaxID=1742359 RepID=A0A5B8Z0S4_CYTDA|nr:nuclear transport factor 2 family protein [Cytobacillus dafuensis]QED46572.1 nuclear transport factor 2 family protein [Cytobacillus dafuensis]